MINLIPPQDRSQLAAARTNSLLLRYVILLGIFIGILILEIGAVYVVMSTDKARNEAIIAENIAKTAEYEPTRRQAETFRSNLATAKYILDKRIPYTTLILTLANNLPNGAIIDSLSLNPQSFGTPTNLTVKATTYQKTIEVKSALQNIKVGDKPLFTAVSFSSLTETEQPTDAYRYTATLDVTYSKEVLK